MRSIFLSVLLLLSSAIVFAQSQENTEVVPAQNTEVTPSQNTEVVPPNAENKGVERVPEGVILVPGAVASASDASTPLPEGGSLVDNTYVKQYFGMACPFTTDW